MKDNKNILEKVNAYFSKTPELKDLEVVEKVAETKEVKEKFEDVTLLSGEVISVEPALEVGASATVVTEDGTIVPLPAGGNGEKAEYELSDGVIIVVEVEGVIADIMNPSAEEEKPAVEEEEEMANDKTAEADQRVKKVIESIVKESVFELTERLNKFEKENEFLHKENDALKVMFAELKENTGVALEEVFKTPSKEPIKEKVNPFRKKEKVIFGVKLKN